MIGKLTIRVLFLFGVFNLIIGCVAAQNEIAGSPTTKKNGFPHIFVTSYGVKGDGVSDDTRSFQTALTKCSNYNLTCIIPANKKIRITKPVFIWGKSGLLGENGAEILPDIQDLKDRYVINLGISNKHKSEKVFSGRIENITFRPLSGPHDRWLEDRGRTPIAIAGRIIQIWRARNASIKNNVFELGVFKYAATAGHNNRFWFRFKTIRNQITINGNTINAISGAHGMEGIGINNASGVIISNNIVFGVGDDVIGVHFCDNVKIIGNVLKGVDGRILVTNSSNILIELNDISRIPSPLDGKYRKGASLIFIGFESLARVYEPKPSNTLIRNNTLTYPGGAIDGGAAIFVRGAEATIIRDNIVINNSSLVTAYGIWVAPEERPNTSKKVMNLKYYPMYDAKIIDNKLIGKFPLEIVQTGMCIGYRGDIEINRNDAKIGKLSCPEVVN